MPLGTWEDRDREGGGFASNLPRGAGLDWRAEPPLRTGGEAGAGLEVAERWEPRCGDDSPQQAEKMLGGALEVRCLGRGHRGWEKVE
jgi:hypothetical protein